MGQIKCKDVASLESCVDAGKKDSGVLMFRR